MRLIKDLKEANSRPLYIVISGDGTGDFPVFQGLCENYNGHNKFIWYPTKGVVKVEKGLEALDAIRKYLDLYGFKEFIFVADREKITGNVGTQIQNYLRSIGITVNSTQPINNAFLFRIQIGSYRLKLYSAIMGIQKMLEEELATLIQLQFQETIDLTGNLDNAWNKRVKRDVRDVLRRRGTDKYRLITESNPQNVESALPNLCSVFRSIEGEIVCNLRP